MFVGMDVSTTNTGIVILDKDEIKFKLISPNEKNIYKRSLLVLKQVKLYTKLFLPYVKLINIESPSYYSKGKVAELSMLVGAIYYYFLENQKQVILTPPTTLKKFLSGNGRASKKEMINSVDENIKVMFKQNYKKIDDLIDAYGLALLGREKFLENL